MSAERVHPHLLRSHDGAIVRLQIDREDKLGALSSELVSALHREVRRVRDDRTVAVLVIQGRGRAFVAGADVAEYREMTAESFRRYQLASRALFDEIERLPQATIAAVNGFALGGGFELALVCDVMIASETARFALPEIKLGLLPGGGGPQRLARRTNANWTKEVVMTGRMIGADELVLRGVVHRVVPADELEPAALGLAAAMAEMPREALRSAKRRVDDGIASALDVALAEDQEELFRLFETADAVEGIAAFLEKRPARFGADDADGGRS